MDILQYHKKTLADLREYSAVNLNWPTSEIKTSNEWIEKSPKNNQEFENFYKTSQYYTQALAHYNNNAKKTILVRKLLKILQQLNIKSIVEIGTGVGSDSLMLKELGYDITTMDLPSPHYNFSKWRFRKYQSSIKTLNCWENDIPQCDLIFHLYVLEHVFNPFEFLDKQFNRSKYILFTASFGEHKIEHGGMPQHTDYKINKIEKYIILHGYKKIKIEKMCFPPRLFIKI